MIFKTELEEQIDWKELARSYGTPLYVYSETQIRNNYRALRGAFSKKVAHFKIHYATKANLNLAVLKILEEEGAGADCASPGELEHALRAGVSPTEILYTGNYESEEDLTAAVLAGVSINLDDLSSLDRLLRVCKKLNKRPEVLSFRINPGMGRGAHAGITTGGAQAKFGIPHEQALQAYQAALQAGFSRFGMHTMTGSNNLDAHYFGQVTRKMTDIAGIVFGPLGIQPEFLDIGGGFGVPYREEVPLDLDVLAGVVGAEFQAGCQRHRLGDPLLIVEPGRYLVADAGWLLCQVTGMKSSYRKFVGLDAGMNALIRPALYDAFHRVSVLGKQGNLETVNLCGPICENADVQFKDRDLPKMLEGDLVLIHDAGAYCFSMSSVYNGRPRPAEVLVSQGSHRLIRRRETIDDLFRFF